MLGSKVVLRKAGARRTGRPNWQIVYPSGFAVAAIWPGANVVPAPGRFSMTIGWPRRFSALAARVRRITSTDDPGPSGTINVRGRAGKFVACARGDGLNRDAPRP